jgi:predicted Rossmann fold nucleotide-binding protein DprA/Smf involved in DNA uptake
LGVSIIGVSIGLIAMHVSWKSDERMTAMANLEFHEKIAVVEAYISDVYIGRSEAGKALEAHAKRIYHDIKGAKQLNRYVDPEIKNQMDEEIKKLKNIAEQEQEKYKKLIEKLNDLQKENKTKNNTATE